MIGLVKYYNLPRYIYNVVKTMSSTTHLGTDLTTNDGEIGDGLLLFYPH